MGLLQNFSGGLYARAATPRNLSQFSRTRYATPTSAQRGGSSPATGPSLGFLIQLGDIAQAEAYLRRSLTLIQEARSNPLWRASYAAKGQSWESHLDDHRALILEARGQFREAEAAYRLAELRRRASIEGDVAQGMVVHESVSRQGADFLVLAQARVKARQGRLAEAEADARRALLELLKERTKYHTLIPVFLTGLADILVEQGRYNEAENLARVSLNINREVGVSDNFNPPHRSSRFLVAF